MEALDKEKKDEARIPEARDAVTVILIREKTSDPFEILLMRRRQDQVFMGGAFVFPGGRLDEVDCEPELAACGLGLSPEAAKVKLNEPGLPGAKALGLFFAAVRETYEEAGILLAASQNGNQIDFGDRETYRRFCSYRSMIQGNKLSLSAMAQKENIQFTLDLFIPYSHWITPRLESRRFDTRFMLVRMPPGQKPIYDAIEMSDSLWLSPKKALEQHDLGKILLMPPTLKHVEELSKFSSSEELFAFASSQKIQTVLPQPFRTDSGVGIKLPYDPEYTIPEYKQSVRPREPSRIMMIDGRWRTIRLQNLHQP
jgi:8-oxo-dGTP pyrophosphatase MutT (NUDIX family)